MPHTQHETARAMAAYIAYAKMTGGRNYLGHEMPLWSELPHTIHDAWIAAANAAARYPDRKEAD